MMKPAETANGEAKEDEALWAITASKQEMANRKRHRAMLSSYMEKLLLKRKSS